MVVWSYKMRVLEIFGKSVVDILNEEHEDDTAVKARKVAKKQIKKISWLV